MSEWVDRIRNHQVWEQMRALGPTIDQAVAKEGLDIPAIDGLERIRSVLALVGKRLAAADPLTTQLAPLDGTFAALQTALTELQAFISDNSVSHLVGANSAADAALAQVGQVVVPVRPEELQSLGDAAASYRTTLDEYLRSAHGSVTTLRTDTDGLRAKLAELSAEIAAERQRAAQLTSDHQAQFSAAQDGRSREFIDAQASRQDKASTMIAEYTQRLLEQNADFTREKELAMRQYHDDIAALKTDYANAAQQILASMTEHRTQVEKLVGVIGNLGVTSGYLKTANHARTATWIWQGITVLALGGLILVAYKAFIPIVQGAFTWEGLAGRIFLSLTVGVLAAYAAHQADKSFEVERRNRKLALELEAIGPYLAPLPQDLQDKFRLEIGERSFGREEQALSKRMEKSPATVIDVLMRSKQFREFITDLVKAARQG
jgi:hypothetical protein